jgi:hypothetical protein
MSAAEVIRIDIAQDGPTLVMRVAGNVSGLDVAVLHDAVARHGLPRRLDLAEVEFLDGDGRSALLGLEVRGAALVGLTPYVELLLRAPGSGVATNLEKPD